MRGTEGLVVLKYCHTAGHSPVACAGNDMLMTVVWKIRAKAIHFADSFD